MGLKIYNTLTRSKQDIHDIIGDRKKVNMYTCGVTVYDKCHIGHARSLYIFDVIRNYLEHRGYDVNFVRNITDIDDKIINKARETGKDWKEVVAENIAAYQNDLKRLGIGRVKAEPRATDKENIKEMQKYISAMIKQDFAYEADGDVYFNVRKYSEKFKYGELSGQSIDEMEEAVRIEKDEKKKDPLDFALWKKSKEGEPSWKSPWGEGRPGWHIECSCMSRKHLRCDTLDIHAGGRDLIFPHHENEIAQAQAYDGKKFAHCWIHHGLLTINRQKMAKSLGNFITIEDAVQKYGANELKMFFLSSHYRSPIDFSEDRMHEARKNYNKISEIVKRLHSENIATGGAVTGEFLEKKNAFIEAMDDDFNTPQALAILFDTINLSNKLIDDHMSGAKIKLRGAMNIIGEIMDIFGLTIMKEAPLNKREELLLKDRETARKNKNFKKSDELRDALKNLGIIVKDTPQGQVWSRA